jgi:metallo-beta-lactamase family protein
MRLKFWGAAQTVTGSMHIIETNGHKVALDCGMFQGRRAESLEMNTSWPCPPEEIDAIILSHAHIDHSGNLPTFSRAGGKCPIYCTHATGDLVRVMLQDSAFIQEKDVRCVNKIRPRKGEPRVDPLYTIEDAENVFPMMVTTGYYRDTPVIDGMKLRFLEAGHILGSAISQIDVQENGKKTRIVYSGDIGRGNHPILRQREIPSDTDYLIMESTYGNRLHEPPQDLRGKLLELIQKTVKRKGKIIIPAFSVGRTQEIVYVLNDLFNAGELPRIPCYVDSPLSTNVTQVFNSHPECFNREVRDLLRTDPNPFGFELLTYTKNVEESKDLNVMPGPFIVISASGMCEAGRILHHLRNSIGEKNNLVLITGYMADHTLGRRLKEGSQYVRIFGEEHEVRCQVEDLEGFSGHADANGLKEFAFRTKERGGRLRKIFLVHGEEEAQQELAAYLRESLKVDVVIPKRGDTFDLN